MLPVFIRALRKTFRFSLADLSASTKSVNSNCKPLCLCSLPGPHDPVRRSFRRSRFPGSETCCSEGVRLPNPGAVQPASPPHHRSSGSEGQEDQSDARRSGAAATSALPGESLDDCACLTSSGRAGARGLSCRSTASRGRFRCGALGACCSHDRPAPCCVAKVTLRQTIPGRPSSIFGANSFGG